MPKKTKKEKLKRHLPRNIQSVTNSEHTKDIAADETISTPHTFSFRPTAAGTPMKHVITSEAHLYPYLKKDLLKTITLAILAIGSLFVLSTILH